MASVNKAFGRTGIPVGAYHGGVSSGSSNSAWAQPIAAQFGTADDVRRNYPDAVTTLRTALAATANGSVTHVSTGFLTNLAALLQSFPDSSSRLTGTQLVAAKVAEIVIMGGDYPKGSGEFNLASDPASAAYVFAHSPVAITCTGASLGASFMVRPPAGLNGTTDPPAGLKAITAVVVLRTRPLNRCSPPPRNSDQGADHSPTPLDAHYDALRTAMRGVFHELGIAAKE
jgi:hypothetical protein